jgi:Flp pilus assembly secretin CpaC
MIRHLAIIVNALSFLSVTPTHAEELKVCPAKGTPEQTCSTAATIFIETGHLSDTWNLDRPFTTVEVVDPKIVQFHGLTDRSFKLEARDIGSTNIRFYDDKRQEIADLPVAVKRDPSLVVVFDRPQFGINRYRCSAVGCRIDYITPYEAVTQRVINENRNINLNETASPDEH